MRIVDFLESVGRDLRRAQRSLRRRPGFALVVGIMLPGFRFLHAAVQPDIIIPVRLDCAASSRVLRGKCWAG